jgi:hypothetical protein
MVSVLESMHSVALTVPSSTAAVGIYWYFKKILLCFSSHSAKNITPPNISMEWSPWEAVTFSARQELPNCIEPGGLLPYSQEPATCPSPELDQYSPCLPIPLLEGSFLYYTAIYTSFVQVASFNQVASPKSCMHLSCICHTPCPSHSPWFDHPNNI